MAGFEKIARKNPVVLFYRKRAMLPDNKRFPRTILDLCRFFASCGHGILTEE